MPTPKSPPSLRTLSPRLSVARCIRLIEQFVHHRHYDPAGLMYSHIDWKKERPFRRSDFSKTDSTLPGPEPQQWISYENSSFISGMFLAAQCYRHQATGEPEALAMAERAFGSIDTNYRLTEQRDPAAAGLNQKAGSIDPTSQGGARKNGWFCKPYGGLATDHTSTEQHFGPLWGLFLYHPIASSETQNRIIQIFREVSQRWRQNYRINFVGEAWDLEQSNPRAQRHMFLWSVIQRMAYALTGDPASLEEYERLDALFGAIPTPRETAHGLGRPNYISTEDRSFHVQIVIGAEILSQLEPAKKSRYLRGMKAWWEYSFIGQREDLLSYYFIKVDSRTGDWEKLPLSIKPRPLWTSSFMLHNAILPVCWLGTRERQGITSAIVARCSRGVAPRARQHLGRLYRELDKSHLKWFADPEGVMPKEVTWMTNVLQGDSLAFYSLGYWYAQAHGIEIA